MKFYKNGLFSRFHSILFEAVCGPPIRTDGEKMKKGTKKIGVLFVGIIIIGIFAIEI